VSVLPLGILRFIAALIGVLLWCLRTRAARTTAKNLSICFPELSAWRRSALARASLCETVKTVFEAAVIWTKPWSWTRKKILNVEGESILQEKAALGKGLIVLTPHLGNWELVGLYAGGFLPLTALYQPLKTPLIDEFVVKGRSKDTIQLVPTNSKGVGRLLRELRMGHAVCVLPDQVPDRNTGGELADFFGHPALTMTLLHGLIQRTGCEVCCCYAERIAGGFKMVVTDVDPDIYSDDVSVSLAAMNKTIAQCVLRIPTQYQWEYKRFRRLPEHYWVQY